MTASIVPASRPKWDRATVEAKLAAYKAPAWPVRLLGVRGYYQDTFGVKGANDRNVYDDAIFVITAEYFLAFNANCDPSKYSAGIATLLPGTWWYRLDWHRGKYIALVQDSAVTVARDDNADPDDDPQLETGFFGINIHPAGLTGTESLGCQSIPTSRLKGQPSDQWREFLLAVGGGMFVHDLKRVPYTLIEEPG